MGFLNETHKNQLKEKLNTLTMPEHIAEYFLNFDDDLREIDIKMAASVRKATADAKAFMDLPTDADPSKATELLLFILASLTILDGYADEIRSRGLGCNDFPLMYGYLKIGKIQLDQLGQSISSKASEHQVNFDFDEMVKELGLLNDDEVIPQGATLH